MIYVIVSKAGDCLIQKALLYIENVPHPGIGREQVYQVLYNMWSYQVNCTLLEMFHMPL